MELWGKFNKGELTQAQLTAKLSELGLNDYTPPTVKRSLSTFGGKVVERGCQEETF
jgi:hypothetical protein